MRIALQSPLRLAAPLTLALALAACAAPHPPAPLYAWGEYQAQMLKYYKNDGDLATQAQVLELQLQKNADAHLACPPGLHGHLALLYAKLGNDDASRAHLEAERRLFPESAAYVDFLLKKPAAAGAAAPAASAAASAAA
ncbi:MAG: DUF4810 domain-containing protein [Pelomonas sp.]|nr:DUF4810 domain-containing protein [Roseateles sp.]